MLVERARARRSGYQNGDDRVAIDDRNEEIEKSGVLAEHDALLAPHSLEIALVVEVTERPPAMLDLERGDVRHEVERAPHTESPDRHTDPQARKVGSDNGRQQISWYARQLDGELGFRLRSGCSSSSCARRAHSNKDT